MIKHTLLKRLIAWMLCLLLTPVWGAERTTYYHLDLLGSPVAATDSSGQVVWREEYKPYGERTLGQDQSTSAPGYTGKVHEEALGLSYYGARWYDPELGRFTGIDPALVNPNDPRTFNRYAYAANNPYKYADPDGKFFVLVIPAAEYTATMLGADFLIGSAFAWGVFNGAKDSPTKTTDNDSDEWIYGPENDSKVNDDGSTKPNIWTSPDSFTDQDEAQDKLDPFKPLDGRRPVKIPEGTSVKKGKTPGGEGPFNGSGGANETLIPKGLPPGSVGPWKPL